MAIIHPITDRNILEKMKKYLREQNLRDYLIFRIGLNFGLSVQELLDLRIEEVLDQDVFIYRNYKIEIPQTLKYEIKHYVGSTKTGYLFASPKGKPISRFHLYSVLKKAAQAVGYKDTIGAITLRKTFAYWAYRGKSVQLPLLSKYLNHYTVKYTLKYLGIEESPLIDEIFISVDL